MIDPLTALPPARFERADIMRKLASASRQLAEFKGVATSIPNQSILINTLGLQEAKDSSAIENIVTTHDELYKDDAFPETASNPAAKEVLRYRQALWLGYDCVRTTGLITNNHLLQIQAELERNSAGFRKLPGTALKDGSGRTVYMPPQEPVEILRLMGELELFINDDSAWDADPLIKMALIHHQFETIHPFYDGNGRTGRILNVLYLVKHGLLDIPILYLSRHIVRTKASYYRLLQSVRDEDTWEDWVLYMLTAIESCAREGVTIVQAIKASFLDLKQQIRSQHPKIYSQDLINNLFKHPYTRIEYLQQDLSITRITATKYLDSLAVAGILSKVRIGRNNYYVNIALNALLSGEAMSGDQ
jgi:Fic family protein